MIAGYIMHCSQIFSPQRCEGMFNGRCTAINSGSGSARPLAGRGWLHQRDKNEPVARLSAMIDYYNSLAQDHYLGKLLAMGLKERRRSIQPHSHVMSFTNFPWPTNGH